MIGKTQVACRSGNYIYTRDRSDKGFQGLKPNSAHFYRRIEALRLPRGRGEIDSVQKDRQDL